MFRLYRETLLFELTVVEGEVRRPFQSAGYGPAATSQRAPVFAAVQAMASWQPAFWNRQIRSMLQSKG